MASANTSWSEENFSCCICLDVFTSPVTTPCGHNFCITCITTFWDEKVQFKCPFCRKLFNTKPDLQVNTLLSEMVDQYRKSIQVKKQPCVEPGDVPCDVCTETQLKAVKSCLVCFTSYCHTHLEPHQRVSGLKKHLLVEPMDRLEDRADYLGTMRRYLDQQKETLNMEMKKVTDLRPGVKKYACELTLDPNTAYRVLSLSEDNRKVTWVREEQSYPDHPERFDYRPQVLCREGLTVRCYWEVEWEGVVFIGVTYRGITRRGEGDDSVLGWNNKSWSLYCDDNGYYAWYNGSRTVLRLPPAGSNRVGVYLDRPAGTLSFYRVSPDVGGSSYTLTHIHTFRSTFTQEDLLPGFALRHVGASVSLCRL